MNKAKLAARTARIEILRERYNPPFKVVPETGVGFVPARTREEARTAKRNTPGSVILQRVVKESTTYVKVR